jgi:hypothetical protein
MTPLAACLAAALALAAPAATATNWVVGNCNDSGGGSLRATVASASNTDTVDLSQLSCSTITLTTGAILIDVGVNNLTLTAGSGAVNAVTIDGGFSAGHHNRVLEHLGTGTLTVKGLIITDAKYSSGPAFEGGCIFSAGNVSLTASTVSHCTVVGSAASNNSVLGGGIFAAGGVYLLASTVTDNIAQAAGSNIARGGGIFSNGNVTAIYSIIANNSVTAGTNQTAKGGGLNAKANLNISYSTISGNQAQIAGGVYLHATSGSPTALISNSTISGNGSSDNFLGSGGVYVINVPLTLSNSTIAFNTTNSNVVAGGLAVYAATAQLQSSIIAGNTAGGVASDFGGSAAATGANNLIFHSSVTVPADTLVGVCPKLQPLADNGGAILTHALLHTSPAIDMGNNAQAFTYDERGQFYPRVFGARADIGAYEWQGAADNRIFHSGFESGCEE